MAEATPEEKFAWRPAPGVRSTSEVYMHIVIANFWLLTFTGQKRPEDLKLDSPEKAEKSVTRKAEVMEKMASKRDVYNFLTLECSSARPTSLKWTQSTSSSSSRSRVGSRM